MRLLSVECGTILPPMATKGRHTTIEAAGSRGSALQPGQGLLPGDGPHQAGPRPLLPRGGGRGPGPSARATDDAEAVRRRGRRRVLLPEAGAEGGAGVASDRHRPLPERAQRARAVRQRRRPSRLGGEPRGDRLQSLAGAPRRPRPPRRAARRPGPDARGLLGRRPQGGDGRPRRPRRARSGGLPQDLRLARHPRQRAGGARAGLHRGAAGGPGPRPRGRAPGPEAGDQQVVEGGAPRGLRRLQPERPRPHRGLRLLGAPGGRRPRLLPARVGRGPRRRSGRASARHRAGAAQGASAIPRPRSTGTPGSLESLLELAARDEAEGLGDAPWPPHFAKQRGEPKRVQPSKAKKPRRSRRRNHGRAHRKNE